MDLDGWKDEWQKRVERHSGLTQEEWRKRIDKKCTTLRKLANEAERQGKDWIEQGDEWDHAFYYQWGAIDLGVAQEIRTTQSHYK